jgi:5-methylcytosine-specific restriction protein A
MTDISPGDDPAVESSMPTPGQILQNGNISRQFGVGVMGGMRRSGKNNLLVLISDPFKGLYQDRWEGDVLHYTGMGPTGDQSINYVQNKTLAESPSTGIAIHLLEALEAQQYTYAGEVYLSGNPYQEEQVDDGGVPRKVWMFPLRLKQGGVVPSLTDVQARAIERAHAQLARKLSTDELRRRAGKAKKTPGTRTAVTSAYVRDTAVAEYAKRLANGTCDLCEEPAPFHNGDEPYLECHHVVWLAKGGEDSIANTVAICPNCHRKMHLLNRKADRTKLTVLAVKRTAST